MKGLINIIKTKRNNILFDKVYFLILKKIKNVKVILDLGSGKSCFIAKKIKKIKKFNNIKYINYDFFNKSEIKQNKKKGILCCSLKNKKLPKSEIILLNDTLHHIFYKKIDYDKIGLFLSELLEDTNTIFLKDHFAKDSIQIMMLRIMDYLGNKNNPNSKLPKEYLNKEKFLNMLKKNKIIIKNLNIKTRFYSRIFLFFSNPKLHFTAELNKLK